MKVLFLLLLLLLIQASDVFNNEKALKLRHLAATMLII
jgi:hypothetical protein